MSMKVTWHGAKVKEAMREAGARGLGLVGELVLEEARRIVPIEEGTLQNDSAASVDEGELTAAVTFGLGPASAYAVRQHEEMHYAHNAGRQAKYLEQPMTDGDVQKRGGELLQREYRKVTK